MTGALPWSLAAYRIGTTLVSPAAPALLRWRARNGKEVTSRIPERYGRATRDRPPGDLVWAHGASIGETLSLLPVVEALVARGSKVLVTSGTATSAEILERRLPPGARHQFFPLDVPRFVDRFLGHWRPSLALFAESEIWPNTILGLERRGVPLIMINGRLSARSAAHWSRSPATANAVLGRFALCLAQSSGDADRLARLGAPVPAVCGNLKFDLAPPPADPAAVERLDGLLAGRTLWMAASTHPGEDGMVFATHLRLRERHPRVLTILAPRHPQRGPAVESEGSRSGLGVALRSRGAGPDEASDVYVVDTVGELGLFFRLAHLVFMGGSLVPHGGQNPFEPARLGAAILHGPQVGNFSEIYAALDGTGGALSVPDGRTLGDAALALLADPALTRDMGRAALETALSLRGALERTMRHLDPFLPPVRPAAEALW